MRIYLAGGMGLMNVKNGELNTYQRLNKPNIFRCLYSFYFIQTSDVLHKGGILKLIENENILCSRSTGE